MRAMIPWIKKISLLLALAALTACSNSASSAPPSMDSTGKHVAGWVAQHWVAYNSTADKSLAFDPASSCAGCHGTDGLGGISRVSCFDAQFGGQRCHAGVLGHPAHWGDPSAALGFHGNSSNVTAVGNLAADCGRCHGLGTGDASVSTASSCLKCHEKNPATNTGCTSCHGAPPASSSSAIHLLHLKPGVSCQSCHFGAGSRNSAHGKIGALGNYTGATVKIQDNSVASYASKNGIPGYNAVAGTCAAVSCHGGQTTPPWNGAHVGATHIDVVADCAKCHAQGTAQFNSYSSGKRSFGGNRHASHMSAAVVANPKCTYCHSFSSLGAQHFTNLTDPALAPGAARATIGGGDTSVTSYGANGDCATSCHNPIFHNGVTTDNWYR